MPKRRKLTRYSTRRNMPIARPRGIPIPSAATNPRPNSTPLAERSGQTVPLPKSCTAADHTSDGVLSVSTVVRRRDEEHMVGEALPHLLVDRLRPAVLAHRPVQLLAELVVGERLPRGADDREAAGEQALKREVVEGGHELALHEIARATEDDDRRRLRRARQAQAVAKRIDDGRRH